MLLVPRWVRLVSTGRVHGNGRDNESTIEWKEGPPLSVFIFSSMDHANQIELVLKQLLPGDSEKVRAILSRIVDKDDLYKQRLLSVLQSEQSQSYFQKDHYQNTYREGAFFDYEKSTEFSAILGMIFGKVDFQNQLARRDDHITRNCSSEQIQNGLEEEGYFVFPERLPEPLVDKIIEGLQSGLFNLKLSHKLFKIQSPQDLEKIKDNTCWIFDQQHIIQIEEVQRLIMDPVLLDSMQEFLGCPPIHVQANSWWSKAELSDSASFNRNAQLFHQDKEFIKFLKIFIYLNDVNEENGPHNYIAGSNKDYLEHTPKGYQISERLSDEYLSSVYPKDRFRSFTGAKGTVIIEDTSGFHKGKPVMKGYRQLLQLEFVSSLYFNPVPCFSPDQLSPEYQNFLKNNPRVALNYNHEKYKKDLLIIHAARRKNILLNAKRKIGKIVSMLSKKGGSAESTSTPQNMSMR
ncbi:MAG: phytanoyl-CoA dioxygenase family protein [Candidatus Kerfeldbacteria bacterium]|nr:phytanoyl-CoA dioxygenase family protein [Candidatus Kerfeldbacteria bacterium]